MTWHEVSVAAFIGGGGIKTKLFRLGCVALVCALVCGCPNRLHEQLRFANTGDFAIVLFCSAAYPDSSLKHAWIDTKIDPHSWSYVARGIDLRELSGITLLVFDEGYYIRKYRDRAGPSDYLEEDSILRRYSLSRHALDTLEWAVAYPAYP